MAGLPAIQPYPMPDAAELPGNSARWVADPARAVLLIHDMQRYFLQPFPAGQSPRAELDRNTVALRERCAQLGVPVAFTAQPGGMTERQRGLLSDFWGPGMRVDPADRQIIAALKPDAADWVLTKWRYSAFFQSDLLKRMRDSDRDQLIVCGVYAHVGVLITAVEAFTNDIQVFLAADAIADFTADYHRLAVEYAASRCAMVQVASQIIEDLSTADAHHLEDK